MRRRITSRLEIAVPQALIDHREATLNIILAKLPDDYISFAELGELLHHSHEWVRTRLGKDPRIFRIGNKFQVSRVLAEEFIRWALH